MSRVFTLSGREIEDGIIDTVTKVSETKEDDLLPERKQHRQRFVEMKKATEDLVGEHSIM